MIHSGDAEAGAGHYQLTILPTPKSYSLLFLRCATVALKSPSMRSSQVALGTHAGGIFIMLDFVLGFAFVAMILSPAALASCLRHLSRMEPHAIPADGAVRAREHNSRKPMRRVG
jgi:hypothetical protein